MMSEGRARRRDDQQRGGKERDECWRGGGGGERDEKLRREAFHTNLPSGLCASVERERGIAITSECLLCVTTTH